MRAIFNNLTTPSEHLVGRRHAWRHSYVRCISRDLTRLVGSEFIETTRRDCCGAIDCYRPTPNEPVVDYGRTHSQGSGRSPAPTQRSIMCMGPAVTVGVPTREPPGILQLHVKLRGREHDQRCSLKTLRCCALILLVAYPSGEPAVASSASSPLLS
jgi:hypothetical protein